MDVYVWTNKTDAEIPVSATHTIYVDDEVSVNFDYDDNGSLLGVEVINADRVDTNEREVTSNGRNPSDPRP